MRHWNMMLSSMLKIRDGTVLTAAPHVNCCLGSTFGLTPPRQSTKMTRMEQLSTHHTPHCTIPQTKQTRCLMKQTASLLTWLLDVKRPRPKHQRERTRRLLARPLRRLPSSNLVAKWRVAKWRNLLLTSALLRGHRFNTHQGPNPWTRRLGKLPSWTTQMSTSHPLMTPSRRESQTQTPELAAPSVVRLRTAPVHNRQHLQGTKGENSKQEP